MAQTITREEAEAVRERLKKEKRKQVQRRLEGILLRYEGLRNTEIARALNLSSSRVSHLVSAFKTEGLEEYARVKYGGNHRNLSFQEEQEILDRFAERAGSGEFATAQEIKAAFDQRLGYDTGRGYIYMLLRRHGWRKMKDMPEDLSSATEEEILAARKAKLHWGK